MAGESAKIFNCPKCGAGVVLRAQGKSISVACGSCGSIISVENENYWILSTYALNTQIKPVIDLGTRVPFRGDTWEVIGFVVRKTSIYAWREYLLYNPFKGYRWLTEYDGHWNFVTMIKERPDTSVNGYAKFQDQFYKLFQTGTAEVAYVIGEFYWRVKVGELVEYMDYVAPPLILSAEITPGEKDREIVWSKGEYVPSSEIEIAFKIKTRMPVPIGVGSCQPFPYEEEYSQIWKLGFGFCGILLLIHLFAPNHIFWNLICCGILVMLPAIIFSVYRGNFEQRRWGDESDVSEKFSGGGDD